MTQKVEIYETDGLRLVKSRFIVISESLSAHCCFSHTVVDTSEGTNPSGTRWLGTIAETFDRESAVMICQALNEKYNNETTI